jgi:hypothetical protein
MGFGVGSQPPVALRRESASLGLGSLGQMLHRPANGFGASLDMYESPTASSPLLSLSATAGFLSQDSRHFERLDFYNVKDYGADGDGAGNDLPEIQAAVDAATAAGGGVVFFPKGTYQIDCTTTGVVVQNGVALTFLGEAAPTSIATSPVRIRRGAGSATMLTNPNNTTSGSNKLSMIGIEWNGAGTTGRIAEIWRPGHALWRDVRFADQSSTSATLAGVALNRVWNCIYDSCIFNSMGNGLTIPSLSVWSTSEPGGSTNTVQFTNCYWESNRGTDLLIGGSNPAAAVMLSNCKAEYNADFNSNIDHAWPLIRIMDSHSVLINNSFLYAGSNTAVNPDGGGPAPLILQDGTATGTCITGVSLEKGNASGTNYLIEQNAGTITCVGCNFRNYASALTSAWRINTAATSFAAGNIYNNTSKKWTNGTPTLAA